MTSSPSPSSPSSPLPTSSASKSSFTPSSYFASLTRKRQQKKMSITQTYYLAHTARKKLSKEASRADHDLRLLVGHANLLDSLMLDLADAEQEQERWFNQTVSGVTKGTHTAQRSESRHIQWAEAVVEDPEEDWDPEDASDDDSDVSEDDSDFYDEEDEYSPEENSFARRRAPSPAAIISEKEVEEDYESDSDSELDEYDDVEDLEELTLTRSSSRQTPPELSPDEDEDSEDDSMPPSPPQPLLESFVDEKQAHTTEIPLTDSALDDGYYVRRQPQTPLIGAC